MDTSMQIPPCTAVRMLGPEDIQPGQYVAIHQQMGQLFWPPIDFSGIPRKLEVNVLRFNYIPKESGLPLKVKKVCLPYVMVKSPRGKQQMLDTRRHQLVELAPDFGKAAFKALKPQANDTKPHDSKP